MTKIYAPITREKSVASSYYGIDYLHIFYKGKDWRINPLFVQIMDE